MELIEAFLSSPLEWIGTIGFLAVIIVVCSVLDKKKDNFGGLFVKIGLSGLDSNVYRIFNDVVFVVDGKSWRIDHIVVSKYGVFVIKTKYFNGYVIGSRNDNSWKLRYNMRRCYVHNPVIENEECVKCVCDVLGMDKGKVFNMVCLPDVCSIQVKDADELVSYGSTAHKIKGYDKVVIKDVDSVVEKIREENRGRI